MLRRKRLTVLLLIVALFSSTVMLQGCAPLVFLAANPMIAAAVIATVPAIIATVPAIIALRSNGQTNQSRLEIERLQAETARIQALSTTAETLSQQKIAARQLELDVLKQKDAAKDPASQQALDELQQKVQEDQVEINQQINVASAEASKLASDTESLTSRPIGGTPAAGTARLLIPAPGS